MWESAVRQGPSRAVVLAALGAASGCSSAIEECPNGDSRVSGCAGASSESAVHSGTGVFQVRLDLGGGGNNVFPVFATAPAKMRWSTMLGHADYTSLDRE